MIDGRIILGVGGRYRVDAGGRIYICGIRGIFRKTNITPMVGDYVVIDESEEMIVEIKERVNKLIRPRVANIDQAVIVAAAKDPAIDYNLCDKLIFSAESVGIKPVIVVNKIDLSDDLRIAEEYREIGYELYPVSAADGIGMDALKKALDGKISAFAGPSGVGKSSIVNFLIDCDRMETGGLSKKLARGKHTTRHAELIPLGSSGYIIDTPGFSSMDTEEITGSKSDIAGLFKEFARYDGLCRFDDCKHITEPGCAVRESIGKGVSERRYRHYVSLCNSER